MNRLIEDKRYDDTIKVFEFSLKRGFKTASGRTYPTDVIMLAIEGLYRQVHIFRANKQARFICSSHRE